MLLFPNVEIGKQVMKQLVIVLAVLLLTACNVEPKAEVPVEKEESEVQPVVKKEQLPAPPATSGLSR